MKRSTVGAALLLVLGSIVVVVFTYIKPWLFERAQRNTSDARQVGTGTPVRIGGDNYLGYWFLTSPEMRKQAPLQGVEVSFNDDNGAYAERLKKFANKEYEAIVLPVNSYLQHGAQYKFPGVIVAAISESKGADGIVALEDRLHTTKVNGLNDAGLRFVYTSESPSSFLLDLTITDFDLDELRKDGKWKIEVGGSREVYDKAKKNDGDVFVLWEPDLSKALELPGMKYIWGSDKFSGYIVDVIVLRRDFVERNERAALAFLKTYFRTLSFYSRNKDLMISEMAKTSGQKTDAVASIIKKIDWFDLSKNARLEFGITDPSGLKSNDGLINTILACSDVLVRTQRLPSDPLNGNPYLITNSTFIENLSKNALEVVGGAKDAVIKFSSLDDEGWKALREVGARVESITFQQSNNLLTVDGKDSVDKMAKLLANHYATYRVAIRGHTASGNDEEENTKLSLERAEAVVQYIIAVHSIDANRLHAEGVGSKSPLPRKPNESERAYRYRLPRVEFVLLEDGSL